MSPDQTYFRFKYQVGKSLVMVGETLRGLQLATIICFPASEPAPGGECLHAALLCGMPEQNKDD